MWGRKVSSTAWNLVIADTMPCLFVLHDSLLCWPLSQISPGSPPISGTSVFASPLLLVCRVLPMLPTLAMLCTTSLLHPIPALSRLHQGWAPGCDTNEVNQTFFLENARWPWNVQGDVPQALGNLGLGLLREMLAKEVGLDIINANSWLEPRAGQDSVER